MFFLLLNILSVHQLTTLVFDKSTKDPAIKLINQTNSKYIRFEFRFSLQIFLRFSYEVESTLLFIIIIIII